MWPGAERGAWVRNRDRESHRETRHIVLPKRTKSKSKTRSTAASPPSPPPPKTDSCTDQQSTDQLPPLPESDAEDPGQASPEMSKGSPQQVASPSITTQSLAVPPALQAYVEPCVEDEVEQQTTNPPLLVMEETESASRASMKSPTPPEEIPNNNTPATSEQHSPDNASVVGSSSVLSSDTAGSSTITQSTTAPPSVLSQQSASSSQVGSSEPPSQWPPFQPQPQYYFVGAPPPFGSPPNFPPETPRHGYFSPQYASPHHHPMAITGGPPVQQQALTYHGSNASQLSLSSGMPTPTPRSMQQALSRDHMTHLQQQDDGAELAARIKYLIPDLHYLLDRHQHISWQVRAQEVHLHDVENQKSEALNAKDEQLQRSLDDLRTESERHASEIQGFRRELRRVDEKHRSAEQHAATERTLRLEVEKAKKSLEKALRDKQQELEREREFNVRWKQEKLDDFARKEQAWAKNLEARIQTYVQDKQSTELSWDRQRQDLEATIKRLRDKEVDLHNGAREDSHRQKVQDLEAFDRERNALKQKFEEEKSLLNREFERQREKARADYDYEKGRLRKEMEKKDEKLAEERRQTARAQAERDAERRRHEETRLAKSRSN